MTGTRPCPANCGRMAERADILCPPCHHHLPRAMQNDIRAAWQKFNRTFSRNDLAEYNRLVAYAVRMATLAAGAARAVIDVEAE